MNKEDFERALKVESQINFLEQLLRDRIVPVDEGLINLKINTLRRYYDRLTTEKPRDRNYEWEDKR